MEPLWTSVLKESEESSLLKSTVLQVILDKVCEMYENLRIKTLQMKRDARNGCRYV